MPNPKVPSGETQNIRDRPDPNALQRTVISCVSQIVRYSLDHGSGVLPMDRLLNAVIAVLSEKEPGFNWEAERIEIQRLVNAFMMLVFDESSATIYAETRASLMNQRKSERKH